MKTSFALLIGVCSAFLTPGLSAQQFSVTGHVVAGGGGTSQGSGFAITGTIGPADAAPLLQNGCWSVAPGFWGVYAAIPTPGAPVLRIRLRDSNYVRVSFTPDCTDWVLQWAAELGAEPAPTVWIDDGASELIPIDGELTREFHVPSWGPRLFFRLRKP